jgi:hypothetical protein
MPGLRTVRTEWEIEVWKQNELFQPHLTLSITRINTFTCVLL